MAKVAVISGTATATSNAVNRRMAQKNVDAYGNAQQQYAAENAVPAPAVAVGAGPSPGNVIAPQAAAAPAGTDLTVELQKLGELKAQGVLTDEEFAAAKAKLLNG
jgi:hypothetical protein